MRGDRADVVVAGAGPTGLLLAAGLSERGLDVLVLEQAEGVGRRYRAPGIDGRGLDAVAAALRDPALEGLRADVEGLRADGDDQGPGRRFHRLAEGEIEASLLAQAEARGVRIQYGSGVDTIVRSDGAAECAFGGRTVRAGAVAVCAGARSGLHRGLGLSFVGSDLGVAGRQAILRTVPTVDPPPGVVGLGTWYGSEGFVAGVSSRPGRAVLATLDNRVAPLPRSWEAAASRLRATFGIDARGLRYENRFGGFAGVLDRCAAGRAVFAGDAAHVFPPFGGNGLNLGLQDAALLADAIARALDGRGAVKAIDEASLEVRAAALAVVGSVREGIDGLREKVADAGGREER